MASEKQDRTARDTMSSSWRRILDQHQRWLRMVVYARLQDPLAVDEVMQELAVSLLRQQQPLRDTQKLAPWLYRVALNQVKQFQRRAGRQRNLWRRYSQTVGETLETSTTHDPLQWIVAEETRELVRQALGQLPAQDREILLLKHAEHWTYQQIAEHLGLSFDKIVYRLTRARSRLRERLMTRQEDLVIP